MNDPQRALQRAIGFLGVIRNSLNEVRHLDVEVNEAYEAIQSVIEKLDAASDLLDEKELPNG